MKQLSLICLHGRPGVGKSTYAKQWQQEDTHNRVIVCREDICNMLGVHPACNNTFINMIEYHAIVESLNAEKNVIVDSTRKLDVEFLFEVFGGLEVDMPKISFKEIGANLTVDELVERDRARGSKTGESVIRNWK